jgi:cell wall-associated NlpC family hydrolase
MVALVATVAGVVVAAPASSPVLTSAVAAPAPPPNPTNGQLSAAAARKAALANQVGQLSGQIAAAQAELQQLQGKAELAEQKVAYAVSRQQAAEQAAALAEQTARDATTSVTTAHTKFVRYIQASYMDGQPDGGAGSLLTAKDPTALLDQSTLEHFQAANKVDAIGMLQRASVTKSNADAAARVAQLKAQKATAAAQNQKQIADNAVAAEQQQAASLRQTLATNQASLTAAQSELATLNHQRAAFIAYQAEQARLAAIARAKARAARIAAARAAAAAAAAAARARARARAAAHRHHHNGGGGGNSGGGNSGGGNSGGGGSSYNPPVTPVGGSWTKARGEEAVQRAMSTLGTPYAWAGGGASGPTYGVCDASNGAPNDCYVKGYDCSGLAMYAWGPYLSMAHYTVRQYSEAGSYHPSISQLEPGDLIFYSFNGSVSGIHHVAVYKGNGEIIQAPYSGGYVEVSSMYGPGSIFGITRPLT